MENVGLNNIYNLYSIANEKSHPQLIGRVVVTPTDMVVLADYNDSLGMLDGPVTPRRLKRLAGWVHGSHSFGATLQEIKDGKFPQVLPEHKLPNVEDEPAKPEDAEKWFKVLRDDLKAPMMVRFKEGKAYLADTDRPMDPDELKRILDLTAAGKATIRHHKPVEQMLGLMKSLVKSEPEERDDGMAAHLFEDPMVPGVGNRKAFKDHPPGPGVYVMLNGNGTGTINRLHGYEVGDHALRAMGDSIRGTLDEVAGGSHKDVWRMVGDQFMTRLPSHEHAASFLRTLRSKLEAIPPVGGTHKLSMNAGLGSHPMTARAALRMADQAKDEGGHLPGNTPGYAHSLIPGSEGPIAVQPDSPEKP